LVTISHSAAGFLSHSHCIKKNKRKRGRKGGSEERREEGREGEREGGVRLKSTEKQTRKRVSVSTGLFRRRNLQRGFQQMLEP
jgi:hypothetical protein